MSELLGKVSDDHGKERKRKCCGNKIKKEEYAVTRITIFELL